MRGFLLILLSLAAFLAASCETTQRHITVVREDGDKHFKRGAYVAAASDYREAVDRKPSDWRYRAKLGETLLILEQPVQAREHLAVANNMRPSDDRIAELYAQGLLESGDVETMFRMLRERAERFQRPEDYLLLGAYAALAGDDDEAEQALLTAARIDGGRTVAPQLALADFYARIGDETAALRRLRMALFLAPSDEEIQDRIRAFGHIPGPSFAIAPEESD